MINNRQAGRRRGRGGNNPGGGNGGGGGQRQGGGRQDNGNRIDSRSRGNAAQLLEKYKNLAADAQRQGDRVNTEYYLQFADHYFRVIADQRGRFEDQQPRRQQSDFDNDGDDEFGDEGEPIRGGEQGEIRQDRQDRQERPRGDRPDRDQNRSAEQGEARQERPRADRPDREPRRADGDRPREPRRWERDERPRTQDARDEARDGSQEDGHAAEIAGQRRADPPAMGEDLAARAEAVLEADAPLQAEPAPRRRGRPRRVIAEEVAQPATNGVEADRLPPSLGLSAQVDASDVEADRPPRRRRLRTAAPDAATAD